MSGNLPLIPCFMAAFLFFGSDVYSQTQKLHFWKTEFEKKHGELNISILDGAQVPPGEIISAVNSVPFLGEKRLVIVKNFLSQGDAENHKPLTELLKDIPDFTVLIFSEFGAVDRRLSLYKKLKKEATIEEFAALEGTKLTNWIAGYVTKHGGSIRHDASLLLAQQTEGNLYRLENELRKLVGYTNGEREIGLREVELLVKTSFSTSIFKLTDSIGQKNQRLALKTLHELIDSGDELHGILYMIMRQFRIITGVKDLVDRGLRQDEITSELKEHPYVVKNTMGQARNFSMTQLKRAYKLLREIDTRLKTGGIRIVTGDNREFVLALDTLIVRLCEA